VVANGLSRHVSPIGEVADREALVGHLSPRRAAGRCPNKDVDRRVERLQRH
jgi:hypothetical protein